MRVAKNGLFALIVLVSVLVFVPGCSKKSPPGKMCQFVLKEWEGKILAIANSSENWFTKLKRGTREEQASKLDHQLEDYMEASIEYYRAGDKFELFELGQTIREFSEAVVDCQKEKRSGRHTNGGCARLKEMRNQLERMCNKYD